MLAYAAWPSHPKDAVLINANENLLLEPFSKHINACYDTHIAAGMVTFSETLVTKSYHTKAPWSKNKILKIVTRPKCSTWNIIRFG